MPRGIAMRRLVWMLLPTFVGLLTTASGWMALAFGQVFEPYFPAAPQWTSPPARAEQILLLDVDLDGHLDLVQAEDTLVTIFHAEKTGTFATTGKVVTHAAVAPVFGDIDDDGDVDLVASTPFYFQPDPPPVRVVVLTNDGGNFQVADTTDITGFPLALFDADTDGDLDLLVARGASYALHLRAGGIVQSEPFDADPVWTSDGYFGLRIAIADFTGDGAIDFAVASASFPYFGVSVFVNTGAGFQRTEVSNNGAYDLAFGDVDGDRDLDLVVSGLLFRNQGDPAGWTGESIPYGHWLKLGDVDADGDLDLVAGSDFETKLYLWNFTAFSTTPTWVGPGTTGPIELGDADGDGMLDLVLGRYGEQNWFFPNTGQWFSSQASWEALAGPDDPLHLADIDRDGDLDLLRGMPPILAVYRNHEGRLDTSYSDSIDVGGFVKIDLGDLNGDGTPELAWARNDGAVQVHANLDGVFDPEPLWSGHGGLRADVRFIDLDRDSDLDFVVGGDSVRAYRNDGGTLSTDPFWIAETAVRVLEAADVSADGYPDLITGGESALAGSRWFRNTAAGLESTPTPITDQGQVSNLALGDVDGDGSLDLLEGTWDRPIALYPGNEIGFSSTPVWTDSRHPYSNTSEFADFDVDGDLDLAVAGHGTGVTVLPNEGGVLQWQQRWSNPEFASGSMTIGDVDADGDLDLVIGESPDEVVAERVRMYPNRNGWIASPDSARVPYGLPDNPGHLRAVRTTPGGPNRVVISALAVDAESDPIWITGEFQLRGSDRWTHIDFVGGSRVGPFATSPSGIRHDFEWDIERLPFDARPVTIRLVAVSPPKLGDPLPYQPTYQHEIGRLTPNRPALGVFPFSLDFGEVTVGDTAFSILRLTNVGTSELTFSDVQAENPDLLLPDLIGRRLAAAEAVIVTVGYAPRAPGEPGPITLWSNDPVQPSTRVVTSASVRSLEFDVQLIKAQPDLPLGEAVTVLVTPDPGVNIDGGYVSYRTRGRGEFNNRAELVPQGTALAAIIPGSEIRESGLEYFVVVTNGDLSASDPPDAPASFHFQAVSAPIEFAASAAPNAFGQFPVGEPIRIETVLRSGMEFVAGSVYYRAGGSSKVDSVALEVPDVSIGSLDPFAVIPDSAVGPRGVEFVVRLQTTTRTLFDPPVAQFLPWRTIQVSVEDLVEPTSALPGRYRMVTVPLETSLPANGTLEGLLSDQREFGPYDPLRWRSFRYRPSDSSYVELNDPEALPGELRPQPGKAFWLIARDGGRIETSPVPGRSTLTGTSFTLTLEPGWNQIGNPYLFPISWERVERSASIGDPVWFDPAAGDYDDEPAIVLRPFTGYFIENLGAEPEMILVSPVETTVVVPVPLARGGAPEVATESGWSARLVARTETAQDGANRFGVRAEARDDYDGLDRREPPVAPGDWVQLAFSNSDWSVRPGLYREDLRSAGEGHAWPVEVRSARAGETLTLTLADAAFPPGVRVRLLDRELDTAVDLAPGGTGVRLQSMGADRPYRLTLLAGTGDYVERATEEIRELPSAVALDAVTPNPLRGSARFRFALPAESEVSLEIFDVAGHRVAAPIEGRRLPPGVHVHWWDGGGRGGAALASGVYFYRLSTAGTRITRRLVLVR